MDLTIESLSQKKNIKVFLLGKELNYYPSVGLKFYISDNNLKIEKK